MNIKALITTLAIIGSSSAAMARPFTFEASAEASWTYGYNNDRRPVVIRDHRYHEPMPAPVRYEEPRMFPNNNTITEDASVYKGPVPATRGYHHRSYRSQYESQWAAITVPTRIDRGRQFVTDLPDLGRFSVVRLQNVAGWSNIETVLIRFKDGSEQVVKINSRLNSWNDAIDIRLDRRAQIHGFVVYGSTGHGSAYQILAL